MWQMQKLARAPYDHQLIRKSSSGPLRLRFGKRTLGDRVRAPTGPPRSTPRGVRSPRLSPTSDGRLRRRTGWLAAGYHITISSGPSANRSSHAVQSGQGAVMPCATLEQGWLNIEKGICSLRLPQRRVTEESAVPTPTSMKVSRLTLRLIYHFILVTECFVSLGLL